MKAIGKSKAMELILTGDMMDAEEACKLGLVSKVVPHENLIADSLELAERIAGFSTPVIQIAKECINAAYEMPLAQGLLFERRQFQTTFAFDDRKEGMNAFIEKRPADFQNK